MRYQMKHLAWVDEQGCLDTECNAVGNSTWDGRAIYCSNQCFIADGHKDTPMGEEDSHARLGVYGIEIEPDCCEHCAWCLKIVVYGIDCDFECDDQCIANLDAKLKANSDNKVHLSKTTRHNFANLGRALAKQMERDLRR